MTNAECTNIVTETNQFFAAASMMVMLSILVAALLFLVCCETWNYFTFRQKEFLTSAFYLLAIFNLVITFIEVTDYAV